MLLGEHDGRHLVLGLLEEVDVDVEERVESELREVHTAVLVRVHELCVAVLPAESATFRVKSKSPSAVGVPEIVVLGEPVASSARPPGSAPASTVQV